jgi:hypothetical protein
MALRSCDPFDVPIPDDLPATLARVRTAIIGDGGQFVGDETAGRFLGTTPVGPIEGRYTVQGAAIRITVTSKPMMVPCGAIEAKIMKYFAAERA